MRYLVLLVVIGICQTAVGQQIIVRDIRTKEPVENVAIFNKEMNKSTITDFNGVAQIDHFDKSDSLFFQHPSYESLGLAYSDITRNKVVMLIKKNILIPEFVVTASKKRENKEEVPYLMDIISTKKIEISSVQNSADILSTTGNIFVQKSQAGGGSPVIRGFEANKVLLVVDGVRMNNAIYRSGHLQNSLTIDNAVLQRVEVIYGPTSVIYGSDALGGVIHYITKTPELTDSAGIVKVGGSAYAQAASARMGAKSHIDLSFGFNKIAFLSSVTYGNFGDLRIGNRRNPFYGDWGRQLDHVQRINDTDSLVSNPNPNVIKQAGYNQLDILQKVRFKPSDNLEFIANVQYSTSSNINRHDQLNDRDENGIPDYSEWYYGPQDRFLAMLKTSVVNSNNFFDNFDATFAFQDIKESRFTRAFKVDTLYSQQERVTIGTGNFDFYKQLSKRNSVHYGLDLNYNYVGSDANRSSIYTGTSFTDVTRYPDERTNTTATGGYVTYKARLHPKLLTLIGLRFQHYTLTARYGEFYRDLPEVFRDVNLETQAITSSLSCIVNQTRSFRWNIIFATGFRSPNLDDLAKIRLTSGLITLPNANLKPEYTYNAEIGLSKVFDGYIKLNGNFFLTYLTDAITRVPYTFEDGSDSIFFQGKYHSTYQNTNSSEGLLNGFSLSMISDLNSNISFRSTLNYTYGWNLTEKTPMGHVAPIFGRTNFSYELKKFIFDLYIMYSGWKHIGQMVTTGEDKVDEGTIHGFPGWYTLNFNSVYRINKYLIFQLSIENLTDNYYKPFASGVPAPGINFVGTARIKF